MSRTDWKRMLSILFAFGLVAAACGGSGSDGGDSEGATETTEGGDDDGGDATTVPDTDTEVEEVEG